MKKLLVVIIVLIFGLSEMQSQNIKAVPVKGKYENVYYRSPSTSEAPFIVDRIVYSSNYNGSKSKSSYQVSVYGKVKGSNKQVNHNVQSTDELEHYKKIFNGRYKKILLYEGRQKVGSKTYFNTSISVEY